MTKHSSSTVSYVAKKGPGFGESIAYMALMISFVALALDIMLPALPEISTDFHIGHRNDVQLIISVLVLGLSIGQIAYGPISDSTGRKPVIFAGIIIFVLGCLLSIASKQFSVMLAGRFMQGVGAAAPRSVIMALVRDQYKGRDMARVMSAIMAVFIVVPAIAPALGQAILLVAHWRILFGVLMIQAMIALVWFMIRQPETLPQNRRIPFSAKRIMQGIAETCTNRIAFGYTIAAGLILGAFLGYLNSAQQVFQEVYGLGDKFPLYVAVLALSVGSASYFNSRFVMRVGMRHLSWRAVQLLIIIMVFYVIAVFLMKGHTPLWMLMTCFMMSFFCIGILFGNLNAIPMEPLGHIAGIGAAVVGSLSNLIAVPLGILIGRSYNGTTLPLSAGFVILSILTAVVMRWAEVKKK
jgi:DHA1 family bicyclomycin/chloramphenicol resistance-like MFS transporter